MPLNLKLKKFNMEAWKNIEGFEGEYIVSSLGFVASVKKGTILINNINSSGYCYVRLKGRNYTVHRLVASAFIDNPEDKEQIDHINCKKTDNRAENLRWATRSENNKNPITLEKHRKKMLGKKFSQSTKLKMRNSSPNSKKVAQIDVLTGCVLYEYESTMDAFRQTEIDPSRISKTCRNKAFTAGKYKWKYV